MVHLNSNSILDFVVILHGIRVELGGWVRMTVNEIPLARFQSDMLAEF